MNFQTAPLTAGLYFVGVPIGSARDITLRALDVLASVDVLAAEDTRSLRKLMDIHGIPLRGRRIVALHDHSKSAIADGLLDAVTSGQCVAYASEAQMPLSADPGFELSRAAAERNLPVTCAPGPSAVLTALVLSGLPTDAFYFAGFLASASGARKRALEDLKDVRATLVFYESPKRLSAMLEDASRALGAERKVVVARELTKKFEELRRGTLSGLADDYAKSSLKGEVVVLIDRGDLEKVNDGDVESELLEAMAAHSMRDAVDLVSNARNLPRRAVYKMALELSKGRDE